MQRTDKLLLTVTVLNVAFAVFAVYKVHQWRANYIEPWDYKPLNTLIFTT